MSITARQLANSFLSRLADDIIQVSEVLDKPGKVEYVGRKSELERVRERMAKEAAMTARAFWEDMYPNNELGSH